jgi:hypothetical protein
MVDTLEAGTFALSPPDELTARARDRVRGTFLFHRLPTNWTISAPHT